MTTVETENYQYLLGLPIVNDLLKENKNRIQQAQTRAMLAVKAELVQLDWDIGSIIAARQQQEGWGAAVISRLSRELLNELPEVKGFSERNIGLMIAFYREYPNPAEFLQQAAAKRGTSSKVPPPVAKLKAAEKEALIKENQDRKDGKIDSEDASNNKKEKALGPKANSNIASSSQNDFYFYTPSTVAYGKVEFAKKWGKRVLQDNWRVSSISSKENGKTEDSNAEDTETDNDAKDIAYKF